MYLQFARIFFLFSIFIIALNSSYAQPDQSTLTKHQLIDSLFQYYRYEEGKFRDIEKFLETKYAEHKDSEYLAFSKFMAIWYTVHRKRIDFSKIKDKVVTEFAEFPNIQALYFNEVAYVNFIGDKNYERAFDAYMLLDERLQKYNATQIYRYSYYCSQIASAYYRFKDYKRAIYYAKLGLPSATNKWDMYNTIGLCYTELNQLDSSIFYLNKAVNEAKTLKLAPIYTSISLGNMGYNHYLKQEYSLALPLLLTDYYGAKSFQDWGLAAGSAITISHIYIEQGNLKQADTLLITARNYIEQSKQVDRLEKYYPVKSLYHEKLGELKKALAYRDSSIRAYNYNDSVYNGLLVQRVQQRSDLNKIENEKIKLENYRDVVKTRFIAAGVIVVLLGVGYYMYRNYLNRLQRDKERIAELNRILNLRQRLSADMHDDIGSSLSSISLYTHSLLLQEQEPQRKNTLEKIRDNAQYIQEQLSDIIWSVNPNMDKIAELIARMRKFGADITESGNIAFEFIASKEISELNIEMNLRRHLYLMFKEALNNAVKYSQAEKIKVDISQKEGKLKICINDNGVGFNVQDHNHGNGLNNLNHRAKAIQAQLTVNSKMGVGTEICISLNA